MTPERVVNDCGLAVAAAELGAHQIGSGEKDSAARYFGMAFAHVETLIAHGCEGVDGAEDVPRMSHQFTETCQAHGILADAIRHAKRHMKEWGAA